MTIRVRGTDQVRVVKKWLLGKEMMGLSDWTLHVVRGCEMSVRCGEVVGRWAFLCFKKTTR